MGGLFSAQQNQLNQLLPTLTAGTEAGAIGSGNFGSLRGQTAVDTSKANALSALQAQQMQAALQNQQYGVQAGNALGTVGTEGINAGLTTGAAEMNAPFQAPTNYANMVNAVNAPTTVSQQNQMSPLSMAATFAGAPQTAGSLLSSVFGPSSQSGTLSNALANIPGLSTLFSGNAGLPNTGTATNPTYGSTSMTGNPGSIYQSTTPGVPGASPGLYDTVYSGNLGSQYYKAGGQVGSKGDLPTVKY
jgi:hypothetical protein